MIMRRGPTHVSGHGKHAGWRHRVRMDAQKAQGECVQVSGGESWWDPRMSKPHCSSKWRDRFWRKVRVQWLLPHGRCLGG